MPENRNGYYQYLYWLRNSQCLWKHKNSMEHINVLLMTLFLKHLPQLIEAGKIYQAMPPLFKVEHKKKDYYLQNDAELSAFIKKYGEPKEITRYKGLGEQNPEELWETTLNPETRTLVQLTTKNIEETLELFDVLMGNDSTKRREYIMENAKEMI